MCGRLLDCLRACAYDCVFVCACCSCGRVCVTCVCLFACVCQWVIGCVCVCLFVCCFVGRFDCVCLLCGFVFDSPCVS